MFYPTLEKARELSKGNCVVPVAMELFADRKTAIEILRNIRREDNQFYILESVSNSDNWSRYTFLGYSPSMVVSGRDGEIKVRRNFETETIHENPVDYLRHELCRYKSPKVDQLPPFTGGFVGYFSYDFIKYADPAPVLNTENKQDFDDFELMLIDKVIAIDYFKQKIYLIVNISADNLEENYINAISALKDMERIIFSNFSESAEVCHCGEFSSQFSEREYCGAVKSLQHYIKEGDIFQAVLSNNFEAAYKGTLLEPYRSMRTTNPSPYMAYLHMSDMEIICASPETLVSLRNGKLSSFPLAGTRPRSENEEENAALESDLLSDEKELSEHDMLVDLARNDLGKISRFGSVKAENLHHVKHYTHVMHISSLVTSEIRPDMDALDAVIAALPAGTLSGAPKKRACELIDKIENSKRGPYGGAIGYIDFTGNADLCIGIRMAVLKNEKVSVRTGAGIVYDSIPEKEYKETLHKAKGIMTALTKGTEG